MIGLVNSLKKYIYEDLGFIIQDIKSLKITSLPYLVLDKYDLYRIHIVHNECVLLVSKDDQDVSPGTIKKHIQMVRDKLPEDVIFVHPSVSHHNRKRLIEYKIPFIIPGNQMYLPDLMIDLRDHFYTIRSDKEMFSPSTQAVILYVLHYYHAQPFIPSELAEKLGYSNNTMTRAFDEIEGVNIGRCQAEGRQRLLWFDAEKHSYWKKVLPHVKSSVQRSVWVRTLPAELQKVEAGETALARYSMLAPSRYKTFASGKKDWNFYKRRDSIKEVKSKEDAEFQLQLWNYDPKLFAKGGTVDKFSLYLSFKDNNDERIQSAVEEMMESIEW